MTAAGHRRIWLCADDYGIAPGVNAGIIDLISRRRLNATSVMVVAPSFGPQAAAALTQAASEHGAAIGLHLTLTRPHRPLTPRFAQLAGAMFQNLERTLVATMLRQFDPEGLAVEVDAQVRRFVDVFGRPPDFIDGHQHVHLFPHIRDAVLAVAKARAPGAWVRQCGLVRWAPGQILDPKGLFIDALSRGFRRRAQALGLATNAAFAGTYNFSPTADFPKLFRGFLASSPDHGLVMCHPGHVDAELKRLDPLTDLREREFAYLSGDDFPQVLAECGASLLFPAR